METKFNFKSQVCTSRVQSERLLALGLKKETADMCWMYGEVLSCNPPELTVDIPAWSLHRLIEMCDINPFIFYTNCGYDNVIDRIEEYIKEGFIDTRYL